MLTVDPQLHFLIRYITHELLALSDVCENVLLFLYSMFVMAEPLLRDVGERCEQYIAFCINPAVHKGLIHCC